jgi:hypothetical protein
MLKSALLVTAGIAIGFGANAVLAQSNAPYYLGRNQRQRQSRV